MTRFTRMALLSAVALLAACGGGGHAPDLPTAGGGVPASATTSATAFASYVGSLAPDDTGAPLDLDGVEPPVSDTAEPIEVGG